MHRHLNGAIIAALMTSGAFLAAGANQASAAAVTSAVTQRFHGDVAGVASGPGHNFMVGDGLYLRFRDRFQAHTRYRVCYRRRDDRRCWSRATGRRSAISRIFIAAPDHVGTYTARWYVGGDLVARWSWYNAIGD